MTTYLFDCKRCTNKAVNYLGEEWCREIMEGRKGCYIASGETGKDFVFKCGAYTTNPENTVLKF